MVEKDFLSVQALTQYIKLKFDKDRYMQDVPLLAEIAEIKQRKGTYYLKLKDDYAILSCVVFAKDYTPLLDELVVGDEVEVIGDISVYAKTGMYQLYIHSIERNGLGKLYQAFLVLKDQLTKEGLFEFSHKKVIPKFPQKIGIVTAPGSAALYDMLITLKHRYPLVQPVLFYTTVQGKQAPKEIIAQLLKADKEQLDVVILARGGGSYEDLQCFNDEQMARTIFDLQTPIITGVGHEVDITIVDLVSDYRAATPTAAIEACTPDKKELVEQVQKLIYRLNQQVQRQIGDYKNKQRVLTQRLQSKSPEVMLKNEHIALKNLTSRLTSSALKQQLFGQKAYQLAQYSEKLQVITAQHLKELRSKINTDLAKLEALSPFQVLTRGFAIVEQQQSITSINQIQPNTQIDVIMQDGKLLCTVDEVMATKIINNNESSEEHGN